MSCRLQKMASEAHTPTKRRKQEAAATECTKALLHFFTRYIVLITVDCLLPHAVRFAKSYARAGKNTTELVPCCKESGVSLLASAE